MQRSRNRQLRAAYAKRAVDETAFYDACKDFVESQINRNDPKASRLPSTEPGFYARQRALAEGRMQTYRQANPKPTRIQVLTTELQRLKSLE